MNRKQAKSLLAYGLLALVLVLASVVLVNAITSFSAGDSDLSISYNLVTEAKAGRAYTPQPLADAHLPFCIIPSGNSLNSALPLTYQDITPSLNFNEGADQSILKETGIDYLTTETYTIEIPVYGTCQEERLNNQTGQTDTINYECITGSRQEQRTREVWKPLKDISQLNLEAGKEQCFDIWGKLQPKVNANFAVDVIPILNIQSKEFSLSEYAWWLSNYSFQRNNSVNSTISANIAKLPVLINSTGGWSSGTELVWCLLDVLPSSSANGTIIFYYNSATDYRCVNQSDNTELPKEVENGSGTNIQAARLWDSSYHTVVLHLNQSTKNSASNASFYGDPYSIQWVPGIVGYGANLTNGQSYINYSDVDENNAFSVEVWFKMNTQQPVGGNAPNAIVTNWEPGLGGFAINLNSSSEGLYMDLDGGAQESRGPPLIVGLWYHVVYTNDGGSTGKLYLNGSLLGGTSFNAPSNSRAANLTLGHSAKQYTGNIIVDEFRYYNKTLTEDEVKARYQILANASWNRLENEASQNGTVISEEQGDDAIVSGITNSLANASAKYFDQQIYTRNSTGQALGKFDVVAVLGNQRWAFNYVSSNENTSGLTNMTNMAPALYVWENQSLTTAQVTEQVIALIDSTKQ